MLRKIVKLVLFAMVFATISSAWEVNTHRAIDQAAIKDTSAENLKKFIDASGIEGEDYVDERFEAYGMTYFNTRRKI